MRAWIDQYEAYHRTSNLDTLPNKDQQAYFLALLDSPLRARIKASLADHIPVLSVISQQDSCIAILERSFMAKHPLFARRLNFFRYTHQSSVSFAEFLLKLRAIADEAELHSLTADNLLVTKAVAACSDAELSSQSLREKHLTLARVEELAEQREVELVSISAKKSAERGMDLAKTTANTVCAKKNKQAQLNVVKMLSFGEWRATVTKQKLCIRCMKKHDHADCKHKDAVCNFCGRTGHISPACYQKQSGKGKTSQTNRNSKQGKNNASANRVEASAAAITAAACTLKAKHQPKSSSL